MLVDFHSKYLRAKAERVLKANKEWMEGKSKKYDEALFKVASMMTKAREELEFLVEKTNYWSLNESSVIYENIEEVSNKFTVINRLIDYYDSLSKEVEHMPRVVNAYNKANEEYEKIKDIMKYEKETRTKEEGFFKRLAELYSHIELIMEDFNRKIKLKGLR